MDAKRGDIGSTAEGYAAAYLAENAPFVCDALTVNPYMGLDTLEPLVRTAEATGKGVIVLARTSNPGSADYQAKDLEGAPLFARVVESLAPMIERLKGESGWSGLMLVTGATGMGKSTTLATMINEINRTRKAKIVTVEDPIEFVFTHEKSIITQR